MISTRPEFRIVPYEFNGDPRWALYRRGVLWWRYVTSHSGPEYLRSLAWHLQRPIEYVRASDQPVDRASAVPE